MKISAKQYAQTLYELTRDKSAGDIDSVIVKFIKLLKENRQLKMLAGIIKRFSEIYNKENGIAEVEVISRRKLSENQIDKIKDFILQKYQSKEIILKNSENKNIKGGVIIKVGDEVLDGSVVGKLIRLRKELVK